ncbi:MAG: sugar phosphate nucleotidyltransferase [Candidatus Sumerlaeota bacterium]|nr:sugar phosphate nucleotidyltransferase [Candidatus Sumerlaeota bacterium]
MPANGCTERVAPAPVVRDESRENLWAIVLAGGKGGRMISTAPPQPLDGRPPQFRVFTGTRTMLQHTLDRAAALAGESRVLTVLGPGQRGVFHEAVESTPPGRLIEEPEACGTAPAIFVAAALALEQDPKATLLVLPSNHFVYPEAAFLKRAAEACEHARRTPDRAMLMCAHPVGAEAVAEWIQPDKRMWAQFLYAPSRRPLDVLSLMESSNGAEAQLLYRYGWLLNTGILAVQAETLWKLGWEFLPDMMTRMEIFRSAARAALNSQVDASHLEMALAHAYRGLETVDFSKAILPLALDRAKVLMLADVYWASFTSLQRVREALSWLGVCPAFSTGPLQGCEEGSEKGASPKEGRERTSVQSGSRLSKAG